MDFSGYVAKMPMPHHFRNSPQVQPHHRKVVCIASLRTPLPFFNRYAVRTSTLFVTLRYIGTMAAILGSCKYRELIQIKLESSKSHGTLRSQGGLKQMRYLSKILVVAIGLLAI